MLLHSFIMLLLPVTLSFNFPRSNIPPSIHPPSLLSAQTLYEKEFFMDSLIPSSPLKTTYISPSQLIGDRTFTNGLNFESTGRITIIP